MFSFIGVRVLVHWRTCSRSLAHVFSFIGARDNCLLPLTQPAGPTMLVDGISRAFHKDPESAHACDGSASCWLSIEQVKPLTGVNDHY